MNLDTPRLFRWDELPAEVVTPQLTRKIVTGEKVMVAQIRLEKGGIVPKHSHEAEQLSYTMSGALKFIIGGETIVAGPGQILLIPSWVEHEAVALEDTFEMDVFSPIRWDWLQHTDSYFGNTPTAPAGYERAATAANPATLFEWSKLAVAEVSPGIARAYVTGDRATVGEFHLQRGTEVPRHQHDAEQISWVQSGRLDLTLGDRTFEVTAGSVLRIPSNVPHSAVAVEESRVVDVFSPRREDWLAGTDRYFRQANR